MWTLQAGVIVSFDCFGGEDAFVQENDSKILAFEIGDSEFNVLPPLLILGFFFWVN